MSFIVSCFLLEELKEAFAFFNPDTLEMEPHESLEVTSSRRVFGFEFRA